MRHLNPTNPDSYTSLASVSIAQNKLEDAAILLLQALLLDNNRQEALRILINVYRQIDRVGNALVMPPASSQEQPRLNAESPLVRGHLCAAYTSLVQVFVEAKQYELAQTTSQSALNTYKCAPEPFNRLLSAIPDHRKLKQ
jgi:tetratricopeptide (TPR) repeat protein